MKDENSVIAQAREPFLSDLSLTAVASGMVAALVSYAGPFAVVLQAIRASHLDPSLATSWVWALAIGSGISGILLSLVTRMPVVVAWSTPGAALLIGSIGGFPFSDAVGAFLVASAVATVLGYTGWFGRLLALIPAPILSALLAGVLLPFVLSGVGAVVAAPGVAGLVVVAFLLGKRLADRYAVVIALAAGTLGLLLSGHGVQLPATAALAVPQLSWPTLNPQALLTIGLPLFLVTMAAQNAPGLTVLRTAGYAPNDRLLIGTVSLVSTLLAPFGGHATNLAAITAAICAGPATHPNPRRRYVAGVICGLANLAAGLFAGWLVAAFVAIPAPMVLALAAVALLPTLLAAVNASLSSSGHTATAALVTVVTTASGQVVGGIGSAFWGLIAGIATWALLSLPTRLPGRSDTPAPASGTWADSAAPSSAAVVPAQ